MKTYTLWASALFFLFIAISPTFAQSGPAYRYNEMGNDAYQAGNYQQAISYFTKAIQLDARLGTAYMNRGNAYKATRNYQNAISDYSQSFRYLPKDQFTESKIYNWRGSCYYALKQTDNALRDYTQAIETNPSLGVAYWNRADVYASINQTQSAIQDYNKALSFYEYDKTSQAKIYQSRAGQYFFLQEYQAAVADYSKVIQMRPDFVGDAYRNRAHAQGALGAYPEAISDYSAALPYYSRDKQQLARIHNDRGIYYYQTNNYDAALQDFNQALRNNSSLASAYYFRGKINHLFKDQAVEAKRDFQKTLQYDRGPSIQVAFTHFFLNDRSRADQMMRELMNQNQGRPSFTIITYNMAGLQALMEREGEAIRYLDLALSNGYKNYTWLLNDPNFEPIKRSRNFIALLDKYGIQHSLSPIDNVVYQPDDEADDEPTITSPPILQTYELQFSDADGNNRLDANEEVQIVFVLKNEGRGDAYGISLQVEEKNGLRGIEMPQNKLVGTLRSGERKEVTVPIRANTELETGTADFWVNIQEENGFHADPVHVNVSTGAHVPPQLQVADHVFASEMGGKMRLGIPITLKMGIRNGGQGGAEKVVVKMELPPNVFSAGRKEFHLGDMAAGKTEIIDFEFFTNKEYEHKLVPIRAHITEETGKYTLEETLTIELNADLELNSMVVVANEEEENDPVNIEEVQLLSDVDRDIPKTGIQNKDAVAVVIGNQKYLNRDVPSVDFAFQDAAIMKRYLINTLGYDENNIIFLTNATKGEFTATFGTIQSHQGRLFNLVKPGVSDVFVYYSGHGAPDIESKEAYFVPSDCDPAFINLNGYSTSTFYQNLSKVPYKSLTVVIDACFSGVSDGGTVIQNASPVFIKPKNKIIKDPNAAVLSSCASDQISSWYPEQKHSLFTYYFLKGLRGEADANQDRSLEISELRSYVEQNVSYQARRMHNRTQTPEILGPDEKVILAY